MKIVYDAPTSYPHDGEIRVDELPLGTPVATDIIIFINPTNGAQRMCFSQLGPSSNAGTPESSVVASPGALCWDTVDKVLYVKDTGTDSTGWLPVV